MAYITNRPEEERRSLLGGQGAIAGGAGGQGMSGAPAPQAGVSKGTGGSQPWVNIQSYLNANRGDKSAENLLREDFGSSLDKFKQASQGETDRFNSALDSSKSAANQSLLGIRGNLDTARQAVRDSLAKTRDINEYFGAVGRAQEGVNAGLSSPELNPVGVPADLSAKKEQLNSPYQYLSELYHQKGLNQGQRALQEQLTRKSAAFNFPQLSSSLSGQYDAARSAAEAANAASVANKAAAEQEYRNKFGVAQGDINKYKANVQELKSAIGPGQQALYSQILGTPSFLGGNYSGQKSLKDIGSQMDNLRNTGQMSQKDYNLNMGQYNKLLEALLDRYGFGAK